MFLDCGHAYCKTCFAAKIQADLYHRQTPECCDKYISVDVVKQWGGDELGQQYSSKRHELDAVNPVTCFDSACKTYVDSSTETSREAICPKC